MLNMLGGSISAGLLLAATATVVGAVPIKDFSVAQEEQDFVNALLAKIGLPHNRVRVYVDPSIKTCGIARRWNGEMSIGIDRACVAPLYSQKPINWRSVGLLAHELGHIQGGFSASKTKHEEESDADEYSAWLMYQLNASLEDAQTFVRSTSPSDSDTHPARNKRLLAALGGIMSFARRHVCPRCFSVVRG